MRRLALILGSGMLSARLAHALPPPTPTPCPTAGRQLHVLLTGVMVLKGIPEGYRVIIPALSGATNDPHTAYLRFRKDDYTGSTGFTVSGDVKCAFPNCGAKVPSQYVTLGTDTSGVRAAHGLIIDPTALDDGPLSPGYVAAFTAPLKDLVALNGPQHTFNPHYATFPPQKGFAAAAIDLTKGKLEPITSDEQRWRFKTLTDKKDSRVELCLADGIIYTVKLRQGIDAVRIYSEAPSTASISLKVDDNHATAIVIGNSLGSDLECPDNVVKEKEDKHFLHQYDVVTPGPNDKFVPQRRKDCKDEETQSMSASKSEAKSSSKASTKALGPLPVDKRTYHGHNCPPAIWP